MAAMAAAGNLVLPSLPLRNRPTPLRITNSLPRVAAPSPSFPPSIISISKSLSFTLRLCQTLASSFRQLTLQPTPSQDAAIASLRADLCSAVLPLGCFAAVSAGSVNTPLTVVASGMAKWLELYSGVLMVRVLLSWFPNIPWERQPLQAIRDMCDPYLNLFRNIVPPLFNALDVSPLLAFLVLGVLTSILNTTVQV